MTILQAYEKYKHLNACLSEPDWADKDIGYRIAGDLWLVIKTDLGIEEVRE